MADTLLHDAPKTALFAQSEFFCRLSPAQLLQVAAINRECAEGALIYKIGEVATTFYLLIDGMIRFAVTYGQHDAYAGEILTPRAGLQLGGDHASAQPADCNRFLHHSSGAAGGRRLRLLMEHDHTLGFHLMRLLNIITGKLTPFAGG